ncbi:MAG TPA: S1C family serine protease [Terriglobales bacterium]|nr:S1C family serine protease [Terriglobales bacterium]
MTNAIHTEWDALSNQLAGVAQQLDKSIVCVDGGHRIGSSGILWRPGIVVTASHMLRRTDHIEAIFGDQSRAGATLLGRDPGTDVAVLRLENASLGTPAQLSEAPKLRLGQLVLALGRSRLGDLAATSGIIARLGAPFQTWRGGKIDRLLRPDVTLYPGQSGSALVDSGAKVLGMNTSALARAAAITVPTATVQRVVNEILQHGSVFRPYLGLAMQPVALPKELAGKLKIARESALMVMQVESDSPSAAAGIMLGDIILGINGQAAAGIEDIQHALRNAKREDSVDLEYARGGQLASAKVKLADRPRR